MTGLSPLPMRWVALTLEVRIVPGQALAATKGRGTIAVTGVPGQDGSSPGRVFRPRCIGGDRSRMDTDHAREGSCCGALAVRQAHDHDARAEHLSAATAQQLAKGWIVRRSGRFPRKQDEHLVDHDKEGRP